MTNTNHNPLWKWLGIAIVVILGLIALKFVVFPFLGWMSSCLWIIAGFFAVIFRVFAFIFLLVAAVIGVLMVIAWIIRQFME